MQTRCILFAELCRLIAEVMQTSIKVCSSSTNCCHKPSMHLVDIADFVHTFADIVQTQSRQYAEYHTPCVWDTFLLSSVVNFITVLWGLQDLRGAKGTGQCSLLPGASTGRGAERPRVVWLIRSSAISGGGLRRLTG